MTQSANASAMLQSLWAEHALPQATLPHITLTGADAWLPSSFAVTAMAQSTIAATAGMAVELGYLRCGHRQQATIDSLDAALECTAAFQLDGRRPPQWAELSGLYETADGYIRLHANFDHHRDIVLDVLGLATGTSVSRATAEATVRQWKTQALDEAITAARGVCASYRSAEAWEAHPQSQALAALPLVEITKTGEANINSKAPITQTHSPLDGIQVLDLTRILAGPVAGRTLAAYGADVMLINSPGLPNIDSIVDTSRGKLSAHADLKTDAGIDTLRRLISDADVFIQGYRPGGLAELGFSPLQLAELKPGIICTSLSAYGRTGPLCDRRGFDSLVQTASGFNHAEAEAFGSQTPQALPVQILDYATGFLMAFGTQVALYRQLTEGGSWHVQVSLARTAHWLRSLGRTPQHKDCVMPDPLAHLQSYTSGYGALQAIPHAAKLSVSSTEWQRPSVPPGTHPPQWPRHAGN